MQKGREEQSKEGERTGTGTGTGGGRRPGPERLKPVIMERQRRRLSHHSPVITRQYGPSAPLARTRAPGRALRGTDAPPPPPPAPQPLTYGRKTDLHPLKTSAAIRQ